MSYQPPVAFYNYNTPPAEVQVPPETTFETPFSVATSFVIELASLKTFYCTFTTGSAIAGTLETHFTYIETESHANAIDAIKKSNPTHNNDISCSEIALDNNRPQESSPLFAQYVLGDASSLSKKE